VFRLAWLNFHVYPGTTHLLPTLPSQLLPVQAVHRVPLSWLLATGAEGYGSLCCWTSTLQLDSVPVVNSSPQVVCTGCNSRLGTLLHPSMCSRIRVTFSADLCPQYLHLTFRLLFSVNLIKRACKWLSFVFMFRTSTSMLTVLSVCCCCSAAGFSPSFQQCLITKDNKKASYHKQIVRQHSTNKIFVQGRRRGRPAKLFL